MSAMYYKVELKCPKPDGYGFKKVTAEELADIVTRLSKPTYNSNIEQHEKDKPHNFRYAKSAPPPRSPSYCSRRFSIGSQSGQASRNKKLSEQDLQRLIRRIRRPTTASTLARRDYMVEDFMTPPPSRPATANTSDFFSNSERRKAFYQLSRPTTASRGKHKVDCHLCTDEDKEHNQTLLPFDYPYADDKSVKKEDVGSIVSRVSSHTRASQGGTVHCWKTPPDLKSLRCQSESLPLVSGLERSKSVNTIVNRLHRNKKQSECVRRPRCTPQATPIVDMYTN